MGKKIGILTSGGDCPGLNAAIRAIVKSGKEKYEMSFIGFKNGFRGLIQNNFVELTTEMVSGILTQGGTILGTSRDKPHKFQEKNKIVDKTEEAVKFYKKNKLDVLICIGGGGTQKNAFLLQKAGIDIVTLPKTIDNDIPFTDFSIGFDTALGIATDSIDRLHSTAMSHDRIIVIEVMGHRAGWIALGAGVAGGADVILIPEIPYDIEKAAETIIKRKKMGKKFSIIVVAEGAMSISQQKIVNDLVYLKENSKTKEEKAKAKEKLVQFHKEHLSHTLVITKRLEELTKMESRLTILGHLQRGGTPSAYDRIIATKLGTAATEFISQGKTGVMIGLKEKKATAIPLKNVAGKTNLVPLNHSWLISAKEIGVFCGSD